ncbi:MAG: hypothetical protein JW953_08510 [Anaerolineae bacterium]|nr:hypothetical protein [Anaerolineae bacterium]
MGSILGVIVGIHALEQVTGAAATTAMRLWGRGKPLSRYRGVIVRESPLTPKTAAILGRLSGGRVVGACGYYFHEGGRTWHAQSFTINLKGTPHTPAPGAAGVLSTTAPRLKPWALLWRLQPVKVAAVRRHLLDHHRLNLGLGLIRQHFPDELKVYGDVTQVGWWESLAHLANLVEQAEWFEINVRRVTAD